MHINPYQSMRIHIDPCIDGYAQYTAPVPCLLRSLPETHASLDLSCLLRLLKANVCSQKGAYQCQSNLDNWLDS
jgi:hypothetical protein